MWMRNQQCLKKCAAEWDRVRENEETAESKFMPFKKRELLTKYAKEKVEIIIAECKAENNYTVDPLFPADEEEHFWSVYVGKSYSSAEKKRDSAAVKTQADCDEKLRNALCGDGQILGTDTCLAGTSSMYDLLAKADAKTAAAPKHTLATLPAPAASEGEGAAAGKENDPPPPIDDKKGIVVKPLLELQKGIAKQEEVLAQMTVAGKYVQKLEMYTISSDLANEVKKFHGFMQQAYKKLVNLTDGRCNDPQVYLPIFQVIDGKREWWTRRESACKKMENVIKATQGTEGTPAQKKRKVEKPTV
jgi:hypothetical protein